MSDLTPVLEGTHSTPRCHSSASPIACTPARSASSSELASARARITRCSASASRWERLRSVTSLSEPGDAGHPVFPVEDEPRAHLHPAHRAAPSHVAVLVLAALDLAPHEGREALHVELPIVGVHERRKGLADALGRREAGEL